METNENEYDKRTLVKPFADIGSSAQLAIAQTMREHYHRDNPLSISPPTVDWCRVMAHANPRIRFDFTKHEVAVEPVDWPALESLLKASIYGQETVD